MKTIAASVLAVVALAPAVREGRAQAQQPIRSTNDAVFNEAQATRGEGLYRQHCASCHGESLGGADLAPALAGPAFFATWTDAPVADLFERIRVSMPQDKPGSLGRQQTADIVAYILAVNRAPAGDTELPGTLELLKGIKIAGVQ